jgi:16S rRNA (guanine527-N7)-methyltransferase
VDLTSDQLEKLRTFAELLRRRAVPIGAVARADTPHLMERHVRDSLRALGCLERSRRHLADVGSGAGLPGIPVALARPDCTVALIEPRARRAAFLELAIEELEIPNAVVVVRPAPVAGLLVEVCLTRALAPPARSWNLAEPMLEPGGCMVYFAGRSFSAEMIDSVRRAGAACEFCAPARFQWQGPLVMMRRAETEPV